MGKDKPKQSEVFEGEAIHHSRRIIRSLKAREDAKRTIPQRIADWLTETLGTMGFLAINFTFFAIWICINTGLLPLFAPFDPFPFGLLTMIVSLEAIFLSIIVLISQNRAEQVENLREEIDLQVDIITEQEITKIMEMLAVLCKKNGIDLSKDDALHDMIRPLNVPKIERALEKQVAEKK